MDKNWNGKVEEAKEQVEELHDVRVFSSLS